MSSSLTSPPLFARPPLLAAGGTSASNVLPYPVHERTFPSGLRVVAVPFDSPGVVAYFTVVRTGSRDEVEEGHSGFAHFFEHMMFRGTKRYPTEAYNDVLKRLGADSNAFTTEDYTNFYIVAPASSIDEIMEIESDRFQNLDYSEQDFKTEALAVLGEYNKGASSPVQPMTEALRDLAFQRHTYKHTTIGFLADVKAMPSHYAYSLEFFRRFYRPENVILLLVGDVSVDAALGDAGRRYGAWKPGSYQAPAVEPEPPQEKGHEKHLQWPNPTRPQLIIGWHGPAFTTDTVDTAVLGAIVQLLFSNSAPLYQELLVDKQWVDSLRAWPPDFRDPYLFEVRAQVRSDDLIPKVESTITQALVELTRTPVDTSRLERVKLHLRHGFALGLSSPMSVGFQISDMLGRTGRVASINELYDRYSEISPADVQRVAAAVFTKRNRTLISLSHETPDSTRIV